MGWIKENQSIEIAFNSFTDNLINLDLDLGVIKKILNIVVKTSYIFILEILK